MLVSLIEIGIEISGTIKLNSAGMTNLLGIDNLGRTIDMLISLSSMGNKISGSAINMLISL